MAKNPRGLGARGGETLEEKRQLMGGENNSILELSFQMGETLLRNGAEISRVQETMERVAQSYHAESFNVYVLTNGIFAVGKEQGKERSVELRHIISTNTHLGRICAVNQLSREIAEGKHTVEEAFQELRRIQEIPYAPLPLAILACGVGSDCFSYLFGGDWLDAFTAFLCGLLLELYHPPGARHGTDHLHSGLLPRGLFKRRHPHAGRSAGGRLHRRGGGRCGAPALPTDRRCPAVINVSLLLYWLLQMGVAFLSTITFAIIFHTPRKEWLCCGFTGAVGWLVYVVCVHFGLDVATASFFATLALAWFARVFAFWRKAPVTVFLITGIFPLVPGAGIYYTGYHLFMSDNSLALDKGLETIKIAVAIALGIGIVLSLPPFLFAPRKGGKEKRP